MDTETISKALNALGVIKSDPEHVTHILNCQPCSKAFSVLSDLADQYMILRNENGVLKAKVRRLETEQNTH